jgi:hypothetical protein
MTKLSLRLGLPMAILCGFAGLALAAASPVVYHSPAMNGDNPGTPHVLDEYTETLDLYYSPGPTATATGEICLDGDGDEICGITIEIQSTGDVTLDVFNQELSNDLVVNFSPPNSLKINRINGTAGDTVPIRLGSLEVSVGTTGGDISVTSGSEAVGASLQNLLVLDNGTLAAPEPGFAISIALGVLAIVLASFGRRALV